MEKKVYRVISDCVEIYAGKTLHSKSLPDSLTTEDIINLYFAQDNFYEKKVCDCATYEDAVKACDSVRIVTVEGGYSVPVIMAEVAYVREITLEIDDEAGSEIDIVADNGIRYYRAKEYHA